MNYRKTYISIIKKAKSENRKRKNGIYFEKHHILPRSLFPNWTKRKSNLVLLTAREHFFCHQLLGKIYPGEKMFCALWILANDGQNKYCIKGSREYERLKLRFSKYLSERLKGDKNHNKNGLKEETKLKISQSLKEYYSTNPSYWKGKTIPDAVKIKISKTNTGRKQSQEIIEKRRQKLMGHPVHFTEEWKRKIGDGNRGKILTEKQKEFLRNIAIGRKWFTNGIIDKFVYECPIGFYLGRTKYKRTS